jgi:GWxTD domain-containing protein
MRRILAVSIALALMPHPVWAAPPVEPSTRVQELMQDGERRWATGSLEQRRFAIADFEQAAQLAPGDARVLDRLGRAYLDAVFLRAARSTFERALGIDRNDPDAEFGLGQVWTRNWLEKPDSTSMVMAYGYLTDATNDRPEFSDAWMALAAIDVERGDAAAAREAGERALRSAPERPEARLAMACLWYRDGEIERSDSLFALAIPRLAPARRRGFTDVSPLLAPEEADRFAELNPNEQDAYGQRFWAMNDPDPTTTFNEARLEFSARLAYATLLFGDPFDPHWRARTELYLRYGRRVQVADELGGRHGEMPRLDLGDVAATPSPEQLKRLGLMATADGHAVFAPLPPGVRAIPLLALVARFESERGNRLLAQVEAPGTPADSMAGECIVLDSLGVEAGRAARALTAGACDPARLRTGDFAFDLPPGHYRVVFAVRNGRAGKGVTRTDVVITRPTRSLAMSDVVLACGTLDPGASQGSVRLNPNVGARVAEDEPVHAYFEVYHLRANAGGSTKFDYEYTVQSAEPDRRPWYRRLLPGGPPTLLSYHSDQEGVGPLRRQYINVPAGTLGYGRYRLIITVHDQQSGRRAVQAVEFDKRPAPRGAAGSE